MSKGEQITKNRSEENQSSNLVEKTKIFAHKINITIRTTNLV